MSNDVEHKEITNMKASFNAIREMLNSGEMHIVFDEQTLANKIQCMTPHCATCRMPDANMAICNIHRNTFISIVEENHLCPELFI